MLPILTSRFSEHDFGLYMYTISIALWLSLLVEFGFNISATKMISQKSEDISNVIFKTQSAKAIISIIVIIFIPISYFFIPMFDNELSWVITMYFVGIFTGLLPQYYFQGTEDLRIFGFIECVSGIILFCTVYFFATGDSATEILMLCLVLSRFFSLTVLTFQMYFKVKGLRKGINIQLGI